jgi:hypothetical protein
MSKKSVIVACDVHCTFQGPNPRYRAYCDRELFTERTWIWYDQYLEEEWQMRHVPGRYQLRYELLGNGKIDVRNWRILRGSAGINDQGHLVIHDA